MRRRQQRPRQTVWITNAAQSAAVGGSWVEAVCGWLPERRPRRSPPPSATKLDGTICTSIARRARVTDHCHSWHLRAGRHFQFSRSGSWQLAAGGRGRPLPAAQRPQAASAPRHPCCGPVVSWLMGAALVLASGFFKLLSQSWPDCQLAGPLFHAYSALQQHCRRPAADGCMNVAAATWKRGTPAPAILG